jgi:hypothetical protein
MNAVKRILVLRQLLIPPNESARRLAEESNGRSRAFLSSSRYPRTPCRETLSFRTLTRADMTASCAAHGTNGVPVMSMRKEEGRRIQDDPAEKLSVRRGTSGRPFWRRPGQVTIGEGPKHYAKRSTLEPTPWGLIWWAEGVFAATFMLSSASPSGSRSPATSFCGWAAISLILWVCGIAASMRMCIPFSIYSISIISGISRGTASRRREALPVYT